MNSEVLKQLSEITQEEQAFLDGKADVEKDLYTDSILFKIDSKKFLNRDMNITIRPHTRFVDFPMHGHNYIEIMYVCQGSITHIIEGKEMVLMPGDILFLNQHVRHAIRKADEGDIGINFIALPEFFDIAYFMLDKDNVLADFIINTLRKDESVPQYLRFCTAGNRCIENLMENIAVSLLQRSNNYNINQITMGLVFLHLLENMEMLGKDSSQSYQDVLVNTTLQYIERQYQNATLGELAEELGQSISALSRMIKRKTGCTFKELLQRQRFQRALGLLAETPLTISEIMAMVGYENSSYFYNQFEGRYHMSPKEYRIQHRGEGKISKM